MFLHAGASLHGHEYTPQALLNHHSTPLPFIRSALRSFPDTNNARTPSHGSLSPESLPRPASFHAPVSPNHRPRPRPRPTSDYVSKRDLSVRFREPETDDEILEVEAAPSEDEGSMVSEKSETSSRQRRKRMPRTSTQLLMAHPAPQLRTKQRRLVQIRPRLLLQMQQIGEKRLVPAFDVVPSHVLAGSLIIPRLVSRCPLLFGAKGDLGPDDLLIVRSEDYSPVGSMEDGASLGRQDLVAIIRSQPQKGHDVVEIRLQNDTAWESRLMANGSYEFNRIGDGGLIRTARWVKQTITPSAASRSSRGLSPPASPSIPEIRWTFSLINPETRRHPIMGTLLSNTLDIYDSYNTMSTSSGRYPPMRPANTDPANSGDSSTRLTIAVPEDVKMLMAITAAWVNLRQEGWPASASPKLSQALQRRHTSNGSQIQPLSQQSRSQTFPKRSCSLSPTQEATQGAAPDGQQTETSVQTKAKCNGPSLVKRLMASGTTGEKRRASDSTSETDPEKLQRCLSVRRCMKRLFHRQGSPQTQQQEQQQQPDENVKCKLGV